jgi:hypothetical protein
MMKKFKYTAYEYDSDFFTNSNCRYKSILSLLLNNYWYISIQINNKVYLHIGTFNTYKYTLYYKNEKI